MQNRNDAGGRWNWKSTSRLSHMGATRRRGREMNAARVSKYCTLGIDNQARSQAQGSLPPQDWDWRLSGATEAPSSSVWPKTTKADGLSVAQWFERNDDDVGDDWEEIEKKVSK